MGAKTPKICKLLPSASLRFSKEIWTGSDLKAQVITCIYSAAKSQRCAAMRSRALGGSKNIKNLKLGFAFRKPSLIVIIPKIYSLMPIKYILTNVRKGGNVVSPDGTFLELDFWIPDLKLAFEFQVWFKRKA